MVKAPTSAEVRTSANAKLLGDLIRAQVQLQRLEARMFRRDLLPILRRAAQQIADIINRLEDGNPERNLIRRAQLPALLQQVQAILTHAAQSGVTGLEQTLLDIANRERRIQIQTAMRALPALKPEVFASLSPDRVAAAASLTGEEMVGPAFHRWTGKALDTIKAEVEAGMLTGEDTREIVHRVARAMNASAKNVESITRTAIQTVADTARRDFLRSNSRVFKGVQWVATLDTRTCPRCGPLDGSLWTYEPTQGAAGLFDDMPDIPLHPQCRCTRVPVPYSLEELEARARGEDLVRPEATTAQRASMDGEVPGTLTWEEWLQSRSDAEQRAVLGTELFAKFKKTGIPESFCAAIDRHRARSLRRQHAFS